MFVGLDTPGYCGLCNREMALKLRQWFICPICLNVVLSYQKAFAASASVHQFWDDRVRPRFPRLRLNETEVVKLEPFITGAHA